MLKAVIIDDEIDAIEYIELIIKQNCPDVVIAGKANSGLDGMKAINENKPDIVFLDIRMPLMSGFEMLKKIPDRDFEVIFTTAFDEYAINAIRASAVDYLLKPIKTQELIQAINKVKETKEKTTKKDEKYDVLFENLKSSIPKKLVFHTLSGLELINITDIIYLQAEGCYTKIYLNNGEKTVISKNILEIEKLLDSKHFFRTHKSYVVNLQFIKKFSRQKGYVEMLNNSKIEVSHRKKAELMDFIDKYFTIH
ncbi:MAG: LytTR family DNA-binding domain-containing protein [Bacteroidales bacterium]|jgi:two-component system LytT family response regulator